MKSSKKKSKIKCLETYLKKSEVPSWRSSDVSTLFFRTCDGHIAAMIPISVDFIPFFWSSHTFQRDDKTNTEHFKALPYAQRRMEARGSDGRE